MNEDNLQLLAGEQAFQQFTKRAKKGCRHCHSKGFLLFDNGSPVNRFVMPCSCTHNKSLRKLLHRLTTKYDSR